MKRRVNERFISKYGKRESLLLDELQKIDNDVCDAYEYIRATGEVPQWLL